MAKRKREAWEITVESMLYAYKDFETAIPAVQSRLQELYERRDDGRRVTASYKLQESQRCEQREQWEELIAQAIADEERKLERMRTHRELLEKVIKNKFGHEEKVISENYNWIKREWDLEDFGQSEQFIRIYYWKNLPKHKAGDAVRSVQHIHKQTMYERREMILRLLADALGLREPLFLTFCG